MERELLSDSFRKKDIRERRRCDADEEKGRKGFNSAERTARVRQEGTIKSQSRTTNIPKTMPRGVGA